MKTEIPDLVIGYNNSVAAAYVTAPDILQREDPRLQNVPFLFYLREDQSPERLARVRGHEGIPYLSGRQFRTLLDNVETVYGAIVIPQGVPVLDESPRDRPRQLHTYPREIVVPGRGRFPISTLSSWYVPYSFGAGHPDDIKNRVPVRSDADYTRMVEMLPDVIARRHPIRTFFRRIMGHGLEARL